ncbi:hypothetical protein GCM10025789_00940 [Tessaracoccus lubricantis]|uniref:DUF4367 domain-containing protein n=1 Tax=Tessaracoccus lubricantis TaxID=545543 RepID=A0ABP9EWF2_9ACTN
MVKPWWLRLVIGIGAASLVTLAGCSPDDPPAPTGGVDSSAPISPSAGTPGETVEPVEMEKLTEDQYPAKVGRFELAWVLGAPVYDVADDANPERIAVDARLYAEPARQDRLGVAEGHQEVSPGVWCYEDVDGHDNCAVNTASGRLFVTIDMFDTLTMDELAQWSEDLAAELP